MGIHVISRTVVFSLYSTWDLKLFFFFLNVNFVVVSWFLTGIIAVFKFYAH